ncbi:hypothetical protein EDEG_00669 [Edhazardia aedis USNM 41457]|uniref:Uncharacterized protein n=1 Tax=Edhazardia aedis (strain USNM 41457) TaxID=1003232 RepID=J9A025_EDHAE|nr:hypothetical protein EDEG_00669 [Edhazardia aedis USNM 41457]|eukprot:EJW05258.1 hypothetical protein EDEG_00669 [Edhazardia aedis USNM 41457]
MASLVFSYTEFRYIDFYYNIIPPIFFKIIIKFWNQCSFYFFHDFRQKWFETDNRLYMECVPNPINQNFTDKIAFSLLVLHFSKKVLQKRLWVTLNLLQVHLGCIHKPFRSFLVLLLLRLHNISRFHPL